jgi:hypothetical protein
MKLSRVVISSSTVIAALLSIGCGDDAAEDTVVVELGATISRTGTSAVGTWESALDLAVGDASDGLKDADYPTGARFEFKAKIADTVNMVDTTKAKATEMVRGGVKMVMVGTSSDAVALSALAYDADTDNDINVPIVCIACSSPALHNPEAMNDDPVIRDANRNEQGWVFGLAMASTHQSQVLLNIIQDMTPEGNELGDINGDGIVKISTVAQNDGFGTGFQNALAGKLAKTVIYEKLTFATTEDVNDEQVWSDIVDQLTDDETFDAMTMESATDYEPDIVIEFAFPNFSIALVKAYAAANKEQTFLHTHSMREQPAIIQADAALNGHEGTSYLPSDGESGDMFDAHFRNVYGVRQSQWDSGAYDTGFLTALAILVASKDLEDPSKVTGEAVRDAMKTLNDTENGTVIRPGRGQFAKAAKLIADGESINYEGASGPCDFDDYGRALNKIAHWRADNQEVENLAIYDCISDPSCPRIEE